MAKRISSFLLCFLMILTLLPTGALAAGDKHFDMLIIGTRTFSTSELSSSGTYTGDHWKLVLPDKAGSQVSLYLYDGFNGEIKAKCTEIIDDRTFFISSEGTVMISGLEFIHPGDATLVLDSKPGSKTRIGSENRKYGVHVGPETEVDWVMASGTPKPQLGTPVVQMEGYGSYQIIGKEFGLSAYAGTTTEDFHSYLEVNRYGEVKLKEYVNVSVVATGEYGWCTGIRTGYSFSASASKPNIFSSNLHVKDAAVLDIQTKSHATNMLKDDGFVDVEKTYHTETGNANDKNYSCTLAGYIPLIQVDGDLGYRLTGNTLTRSTDGIADFEVSWLRNNEPVNLPYVVDDGIYVAVIRVTASPGYQFMSSTKMTAMGEVLGYQTNNGGQLTFYTKAKAVKLPVITEQTKEITAAVGQTVTASVKANGADSYQWYFCDKDGQAYPWLLVDSCAQVTGINTSTLEFVPSPFWLEGGWPGDGVYVYCKISNDTGYVFSDKIQVDVKPQGEGPSATYVFPFTDVKPSDWFYSDVVYANRNGLINGKTPTLYKPADNMTYAEAIKLACCMHQFYNTGKVTLQNGSPNWYDSYISYAKEHGIAYVETNLNGPISREAYVHTFYSALPESSYTVKNNVTSLPDVPTVNPFLKEILTFYNAGILTGNDPKGTFMPKSSIKRSEVAAILTRMMDDSARKTYTLVP